AVIGEQGEEIPELGNGGAPQSAEKPAEAPAREPERAEGRTAASAAAEVAEAPQPVQTDGAGARIKASPLARRIARERGIELGSLKGTGPEGRVVAEDVERAAAGAPTVSTGPVGGQTPAVAGTVEHVPLTNVRRTIARRLTEAWQIPVFQLVASADMSRVNGMLERLREDDAGPRVTVTDVLTKASAAALMRHREVNAQWSDDAILLFPTANIGIAVAAPQGLVVPVIKNAERLQLAEIAAARADVVTRARENKLRQEDLEGGTFTISNLGMYRVERFTAVLNPPQAAIVAVGAIEDAAIPIDGEVVVRPLMTLSATFDHRTVDGAPAANFLQTLKELLEEPGLML
ncbi:MAG TPA: dihydrolipoamide acetyltransferase family protein, partial [Gaiellaceae bacterium]|nr:dihydrolipoamide acetyltransferase family protein [Gaiellaceae bacterium]